jgi:hypothetical protein
MNNTSGIHVTYSHPDLPRCGVMSGHLAHDPWEGVTVFMPAEEHNESVLSYLTNRKVASSSKGRRSSPSPETRFALKATFNQFARENRLSA